MITGRKLYLLLIASGIIICLIILYVGKKAIKNTSTDEYCMSCHVHPHVEQTWKMSPHHDNRTGVIVHCTECHLPPEGHGRFLAKAKTGIKDVYGYLFKDSADFNWEQKRTLEAAKHFVYTESCIKCHQNLFPVALSTEGEDAHLNYITSKDEVNCLNCHLDVGHYDPNRKHEHNTNFGQKEVIKEVFTEPAKVEDFKNYTEKIPGTSVSFDMVAIPGGQFDMGSPKDEQLRDEDEGPVHPVVVSDFWMGKIEVSWDEYLAFFAATSSQGHKAAETNENEEVDGISGPTPPWGAPDQGWGKGSRPAITMSWHSAYIYCRWLSKVTGKRYRLPTEAEWEYACRGGSKTPYPFKGSPKDYTSNGLFKKIFGVDTTIISSNIVYKENSPEKTQEPSMVRKNPFGLKNMLGNVNEFCLDFYSPNAYKSYKGVVTNPVFKRGKEHVVRGGSFKSDAKDLRSAARDYTKTKAWLVTDPQMPKSIWWYSDCIDIGFRVVCEPQKTEFNK